ncbi:hypothetical protein C8F01DRAFT_1017954 [Mycena amicta]|nr:hypothetical protein C8F01DRAFT_1017954 [Mycena amicta]
MSTNNALWGQLLRKTTLARDAPLVAPTAPLDKTGTSMRVLLHDTQHNFERFSHRVDSLSSGIEDARQEIVVVKDLFNGAQESLVNDVVDVVNRCQTHVQKAIGDPAQASVVEQFRKDVDTRLDGLSKRIDDMQSFNQTQSLALQNALQMLNAVQEQQGQILTALLPLQPLLQAVPVHIDSARSRINEAMLKMSLKSTRTPPQSHGEMTRKRSFLTSIGPPSSPRGARKKARLESEHAQYSPASRPSGFSNHAFRPARSPSRGPPIGQKPSLSSIFRDANIPRRPLGDLVFSFKNTAVPSPSSHVEPAVPQPASPSAAPMTPPSSFGNIKRSPDRDDAPSNSSPAVKTHPSPSQVTTTVPQPAGKPQTNPNAAPTALKVTMRRGRRSPFVRVPALLELSACRELIYSPREMEDGLSRWTMTILGRTTRIIIDSAIIATLTESTNTKFFV